MNWKEVNDHLLPPDGSQLKGRHYFRAFDEPYDDFTARLAGMGPR